MAHSGELKMSHLMRAKARRRAGSDREEGEALGVRIIQGILATN
jgi:hypothetical protein